ncbi:PH domain-containing protein DDB_G0287875 isoform X3 [Oncorhynchus mykiss]|uniref:PH domain-containing protein DDB_G0287875 isoform X3 n=1 Tax=Oncorhynchus mykiss TaxID=8022 RepID=UPI001877FDA2|nr:PH domain-containing protein DDB_G0287875 isoform X3 [Oncorhynchus mykiss]
MSLNITVKSEDSESFDEEDESSPLLSGKRGSESAARHDISPGEGGPIEDHAGYSTQHGRLAIKTTSKPIVLSPVMTLPTSSPEFSSQAIVYLIEAVGCRWSLYGTRERSQLFQSVQKELEEQGHCLPVEKIRRKWNNLIVTYKRVKYRGRETGQARTSWEYFEMMDAMLGDTIGAETTSSPTLVTSIPKVNVATETTKTEQKPLLLPHGNLITACTRTLTLVPSSLPLHTPVPSTLPLYTFVRSPPTPVCSSLPLPNPLDTPSPRIANNTDPVQPNPSPAPVAQPPASCHFPSNLSRVHLRRKKRGCFSSSTSKGSSITSPLVQQQKRGEGTSLLQEFLRRQEGHAEEEQVCRSRAEAQGRRYERREVCMAESLGRMATALELLSSKQDTVIALLQRLAERDGK